MAVIPAQAGGAFQQRSWSSSSFSWSSFQRRLESLFKLVEF